MAGMFGPTIIAQVRQATGHYQGAMTILAIVMLVSTVVPLLVRPPKAVEAKAN
jgi:MFS transporter, OFA family, oxalate/formate antiporter